MNLEISCLMSTRKSVLNIVSDREKVEIYRKNSGNRGGLKRSRESMLGNWSDF